MKERINSAKAAGVPHLESPDPERFYGAATGFDTLDPVSEMLPPGAVRMSAAETVAALAPACVPAI
jgi:hypothetical protein